MLRKNNIYLFTVILLFAASTLFAGAGREHNQTAGKITLRVLNYFDMTSANSAGEIIEVWDAFEKANSDIQIIREDLFNEPFHNKVEAYAAAGQLPDVIYAWPSGRSTTLHTQHLLKDLGTLVNRDNLALTYTATALDPASQGGGYIGILPRAITSSHAFYVNNEVLQDAGLSIPKNYDELKSQVAVLRAKGYETILMANQESWVMQSCLFSLVAGRFCGEGWEKRIHSGQIKFTDPDFVKALRFIKTMYDDGVLSRSTLTTDYGSVIGQFATNKGAYYIDGDWRIGSFITDVSTGQALIPPAKQNNIHITVFPDIEGAKFNKSTSVILGTGWGINANIPTGSAKEDAAWRLVKWLSGKEVQTWLLLTGGISTPTRTDINTGGLTLEPMQKEGGNLGNQYTTGTVVFDGAFESDINNAINDGLQEIGMGTRTPEQIAQSVQRIFDSWQANR
jgi:raffinose/stachyose/melibiose transport system substrate-binding protein